MVMRASLKHSGSIALKCETLSGGCLNIKHWEIAKHCYHIPYDSGCHGPWKGLYWCWPKPHMVTTASTISCWLALWNSVSTSANTWTGFKDLSQTSHLQKKPYFGQESIQVCKYLAIMGGRGRPERVFTAWGFPPKNGGIKMLVIYAEPFWVRNGFMHGRMREVFIVHTLCVCTTLASFPRGR